MNVYEYLVELREPASKVHLLLLVLCQPRAMQLTAAAIQACLLLLLFSPAFLLLVPLIHQCLRSVMFQSAWQQCAFHWKVVSHLKVLLNSSNVEQEIKD